MRWLRVVCNGRLAILKGDSTLHSTAATSLISSRCPWLAKAPMQGLWRVGLAGGEWWKDFDGIFMLYALGTSRRQGAALWA